jgi:hypothetical protein
MTKLRDWVDKVNQVDRGLAALLRGLVLSEHDDGTVTFVWYSAFHKKLGAERSEDIRPHLGALSGRQIVHKSLEEWAREDPMLQEALDLGARIKQVD